jgi:hypothetical protein
VALGQCGIDRGRADDPREEARQKEPENEHHHGGDDLRGIDQVPSQDLGDLVQAEGAYGGDQGGQQYQPVHEHREQLGRALPDIRTHQDAINPGPIGGYVESDRQQEPKHQSFHELGTEPTNDDDS